MPFIFTDVAGLQSEKMPKRDTKWNNLKKRVLLFYEQKDNKM